MLIVKFFLSLLFFLSFNLLFAQNDSLNLPLSNDSDTVYLAIDSSLVILINKETDRNWIWGIIVGFISIILTFIILKNNIKHNRLSVKPIPDILTSNFENKIVVSLENNGTGPLIIKTFRANVGDESKPNVIDWMPNLPDGYYWSNWLRNFEGSAIKPFESKTLLEFKLDLKDEKQREIRDNIRKTLSRVSIDFEYTDIYGTKMYFPFRLLSSAFGSEN